MQAAQRNIIAVQMEHTPKMIFLSTLKPSRLPPLSYALRALPFWFFSVFFFFAVRWQVCDCIDGRSVAPAVIDDGVVIVDIFCLLVASLSACMIDAINLNSLPYQAVFEKTEDKIPIRVQSSTCSHTHTHLAAVRTVHTFACARSYRWAGTEKVKSTINALTLDEVDAELNKPNRNDDKAHEENIQGRHEIKSE